MEVNPKVGVHSRDLIRVHKVSVDEEIVIVIDIIHRIRVVVKSTAGRSIVLRLTLEADQAAGTVTVVVAIATAEAAS